MNMNPMAQAKAIEWGMEKRLKRFDNIIDLCPNMKFAECVDYNKIALIS